MHLKEDYPDDENAEAKCFQFYADFNLLHEFEAMRPKPLNSYQNKLLNLFYKCRAYSEDSKSIPFNIIKHFCNCDFCEPDIAEYIVCGLDNQFLKMCSDKIKRDLENLKNKGRQ